MAFYKFEAPTPQESALDRIAKLAGIVGTGANVAGNVYGIRESGLKSDLLQHQIQEAKDKDARDKIAESPESDQSKLSQQFGEAALRGYAKYLPKESQSALQDAIVKLKGTPAQGVEGQDGYVPAHPGMSSQQITALLKDESPLTGYIKGAQSAEAIANKYSGIADSRHDSNQQRASGAYDKVIKAPYEDRIDAADRVKRLITAASTGELIPSETLGQQLATDLNLLQAGHATVSGTNHTRPNTLFGKAGTLAHFISGDPQAAITPGDLNQMIKETDLLRNEIGSQHANKFRSWIKGQPRDIRGPLEERFNQARTDYFPQGAAQVNPGNVETRQGPPAVDMIDVISPEGVPGTMPNDPAKIAAAIRKGFKRKPVNNGP